jgi:hypothetical protein
VVSLSPIHLRRTQGEIRLALVEIVMTVCALSQPNVCEDKHLQFNSEVSLNQCVMAAQPYIAQWIGDHPKWTVMRWRCEYPKAAKSA